MAFKKEIKDTSHYVRDDIKSGNFKRFYLLSGDETYSRDLDFSLLKKALMPEMAEMNFSEFDGRFMKGAALCDAIIEAADTLPFFAEKKLISVSFSGFFKKADEHFTEYIKKMPESTILIFKENECDKRLSLTKYFDKEGRLSEYPKTLEGLRRPILTILAKNKKQIRPSTYERLIDKAGLDMEFISHELEKLIAYTEGREEITIADVNAVVSDRTEEDAFALTNAMADRNKKAALDALYDKLRLGTNMFGILTMLYHQFNTLLIIKEAQAKGISNEELAAKLNYKPYAVKQRAEAAARYTYKELTSFINDCAVIQEKIRTGETDPEFAVERLIIKYSSRIKAEI